MQENRQDLSLIKQNILLYLDFKGISKYEFYKKSGISRGTLDNSSGITEDGIAKFIAYAEDVNPSWLITGKGSMLSYSTSSETNTVEDPKENYSTKKAYPLLPFDAFGGNGGGNSEGVDFATIEDRYVVPLFDGLHVDFMIPVRGSSMYPKYNSGDVVACRIIKDLMYIQWNKTFVIDTYSQGTILKRLKKSTTDDHVICKSDNKDYDEFELPRKDIRNIALVVGVIRLE